MNDCGGIREKISTLIDGEVSESERAEIEKHIEACTECRRMYEAFTAVSDSLGELEEVPQGLHEDIMRGVKKARQRPLLRKILPLAACFVLIFGVVAMKGMDNNSADEAAPEDESLCVGTAVNNGGDSAVPQVEIIRRGVQYAADKSSINSALPMENSDAEEIDASRLRELLTPTEDRTECKSAPTLCYTVLIDGETADIYFDGDAAFADYGDGLVSVTGTATEIRDILR